MNPMFIPIITWGEVKAAMDGGRPAYYVDGGDFWDIYVDAPVGLTEIMKVEAFGRYPDDVTRYFSKDASQDFETNYMPRLNTTSVGQGE